MVENKEKSTFERGSAFSFQEPDPNLYNEPLKPRKNNRRSKQINQTKTTDYGGYCCLGRIIW